MKLSDDLNIIRRLRVPYKHELIQWIAHLYTNHSEAMQGIDGRDLKDLIYSHEPTESIAKILETAPTELKAASIEKFTEAGRPRPTTAKRGRDRDSATTAPKSSKPTGSRRRKSTKGSRG